MPEPDHPVEETAAGAAQVLQGLSPGQLAELRRMEAPAPVPVFWLLAARYRHTIGPADPTNGLPSFASSPFWPHEANRRSGGFCTALNTGWEKRFAMVVTGHGPIRPASVP